MKQIKIRLEELEARRPEFGLPVAQMTDAALIAFLTGGKSETISDAELERIIAAETVADQGSRGDQAI
jgi:hypothetical protein